VDRAEHLHADLVADDQILEQHADEQAGPRAGLGDGDHAERGRHRGCGEERHGSSLPVLLRSVEVGFLADAVSGMIASMTRWVGPVVGVLLVLLGGLWTLQGVGVVGGSFMTGSRLWLVIGLVLVVAGVALLLRLRRRPRGVR
jgi:hypothetical protein